MNSPIIFKTEDSLWQMMANGNKWWDARRYDLGDDRIHRLSRVTKRATIRQIIPWAIRPEVDRVWFINKATGEGLAFEYLRMEFAPWATDWCFLVLGQLLETLHADDAALLQDPELQKRLRETAGPTVPLEEVRKRFEPEPVNRWELPAEDLDS